jgi:hypothetical protein
LHDAAKHELSDGVVRSSDITHSPDSIAELRFGLDDGSFTQWQPLELDFQRHTDPDFNGDGCSCTWYDASALVIVPGAARQALRNRGPFPNEEAVFKVLFLAIRSEKTNWRAAKNWKSRTLSAGHRRSSACVSQVTRKI